MDLSVSSSWVVPTSAYLEGEVERMLLLLRPEELNEVNSFLSQEHVARVTKVCCVDYRSLFIKSCQYASAAADLSVVTDRINEDVFWAHFVPVVALEREIGDASTP